MNLSKEGFNYLASKKLKLPIQITNPIKICDLKPAYGVIFEDYIGEFDFWGHIDIDIILGNIRHFMTEEKLDLYDLISVSHLYPSGFFCLYRNISVVNQLFEKSKNYPEIFTNPKHLCFDECNFSHSKLKGETHLSILNVPTEIDSMAHIIAREEKNGAIKTIFNTIVIEGITKKLEWEEGYLIYDEYYQVLLYHLIIFKKMSYAYSPKVKKIPNHFFIIYLSIRRNSFFLKIVDFIKSSIKINIGKIKLIAFIVKSNIKKILNYKVNVSNKIMGIFRCQDSNCYYLINKDKKEKNIYVENEFGEKYLLRPISRNVFVIERKKLNLKYEKNYSTIRLISNNGRKWKWEKLEPNDKSPFSGYE